MLGNMRYQARHMARAGDKFIGQKTHIMGGTVIRDEVRSNADGDIYGQSETGKAIKFGQGI
jgi:hypothetical protein